MSSKNYLNFNELRENLSFERVLKHYGVEMKATENGKGAQLVGPCSLSLCRTQKNDGTSLSVNLDKKVFFCHRCKSKGSVLDFVCLMEGADPLDGQAFRQIMGTVVERILSPSVHGEDTSDEEHDRPAAHQPSKVKEREETPMVENAPLDFQLKLESDHGWFKARGLTPETVKAFGLGYANRGFLKGRIAIPVHDLTGNLVGYGGRLVDENLVTKDNPLFKFPEPRLHDGVRFVFRQDQVLYGADRLHFAERLSELVLVQGMGDVWRFHEDGIENAVAAMGGHLSEAQAQQVIRLIKPGKGRVRIIPDATEAGASFAQEAISRLITQSFCQWVQLPSGTSPAGYSWEKIPD